MELRPQPVEQWRTLALLWTAILSGPLAWACDEVVGYSATAHECSTGHMLLLHGLTVGGLLACAVGLLCALTVRSGTFFHALPEGGRRQRIHSMVLAGIFLSVGFALAIMATAIPKWILTPCD